MYLNHTPEISDHLAELACDDHRVVLNSSHICADGGYLASLVNRIQSKEDLPIHPSIPDSIVQILNNELSSVKKNNKVKLAGANAVTYLLNQKVDNSVPEESKCHSVIEIDDSHNLAC